MSNTSNINKKFGQNIRLNREKQSLSQEKLALNSGLDRTYVSGIERGIRNPSLKNIEKIAKGLNVTIRELF